MNIAGKFRRLIRWIIILFLICCIYLHSFVDHSSIDSSFRRKTTSSALSKTCDTALWAILIILLRRLDDWLEVTGKSLNWFKWYLTGRRQRVNLGDCLSSKADLNFGVPRGSDLGPLLFTFYTPPMSRMIAGQAIPRPLYAEDSQLYVSFASNDSTAAINILQSCTASVHSWMLMNKLKLNSDKTELLVIGKERQLCFLLRFSVSKLTQQKLLGIFNQSINQSNFYSANIPGVARLSGATARSVFKCEVVEVVP